LIDLSEIKSRGAVALLETYTGKNPYIKKLRGQLAEKGKVQLTEGQVKYINQFHGSEPQLINKVVTISEYLGETLKESNKLSFTPQRILIQFMLADQEKTYHIYGKLKQNQEKSEMYFLPKTQVLDDPYFTNCDISVDWDKYIKLDTKDRTPYEHQKSGIEFLLCRDGAILADDMGLGKTYQSIVAALECEAKKVLIVCPSSMKITWQREIECFQEESIIVGGSKWPIYCPKFTIINFEILKNFHTIGPPTQDENGNPNTHHRHLVNQNYDLIIIDEAHKVKDHKSQRGQIINEITLDYGIHKSWLLTGTPIANRPMDFYNLLKLVSAKVAENWMFFAKRYCDGKSFYKKLKNGKTRRIWITKGSSNLGELSIRTKNKILRRVKTEVLDMPDKTITTHYHELSKRAVREYEGLWDDYIERRAEEGRRKIGELHRDIVELGLLRKFCAMESIPYTVELAQDAIEQGQKVVIFTTFTDELEGIAEQFGNECVIHNGKMTMNAKQKSVDSFQDSPNIKVFVGNIMSAGVGITLTEGTVVIFNSFDWVPGNNEQAEDRCYRIGQDNNVSVYYQLFKGTVSIPMWYTIMNKIEVINQIIGNGGEDGERLKMLMDELEENGLEL
jgi:SWI/SNF-related matrix-associated actin-dependent regulator 1 of chromatin subfamily A